MKMLHLFLIIYSLSTTAVQANETGKLNNFIGWMNDGCPTKMMKTFPELKYKSIKFEHVKNQTGCLEKRERELKDIWLRRVLEHYGKIRHDKCFSLKQDWLSQFKSFYYETNNSCKQERPMPSACSEYKNYLHCVTKNSNFYRLPLIDFVEMK
ncbi:MAG: hypothetical protein ACOYL6_18460 [Bacteriovoracaceae bacterium]